MSVRYPVFIALTLCLAALLAMAGAGSARAQEPGVDLGVYAERVPPLNGEISLVVANYGTEDALDVRVEIEFGPDFYEYEALAHRFSGHSAPSAGSVTNHTDNLAIVIWDIPRLPAMSSHHLPLLSLNPNNPDANDFSHWAIVVVATASSASVETESKRENNRVEIWLRDAGATISLLRPAPFRLETTVDIQAPQPGQQIVFDISAFFEQWTLRGETQPAFILSDTVVRVQLTPGLTYSGAEGAYETRKLSHQGNATPEHDKSTYSHNQADNAGLWDIGPFVAGSFHLDLTATVNADADGNIQCLTAEISGRPAEQLGGGIDRSLDNVARVCVQPQQPDPPDPPVPTVLSRGEVSLFTWYDCVGEMQYPCDSANNEGGDGLVVVASPFGTDVDAASVAAPGDLLIHVRDLPEHRHVVGNKVHWSTGYSNSRQGIRLGANTGLLDADLPLHSGDRKWGDQIFNWGGQVDVSGSVTPPPGGVFAAKWLNNGAETDVWPFTNGAINAGTKGFTGYPNFRIYLTFAGLGRYDFTYKVDAEHHTNRGQSDDVVTQHTDTAVYVFQVGPMADLAVDSVWETAQGLQVAVVNYGPDPSPGGQVRLNNGESCDFDQLHPYSEIATCTFAGAQLTGEGAIGTIEDNVKYGVCINLNDGSNYVPLHDHDGDDDHDVITEDDCPNTLSIQWHSVDMYDPNPHNNDIRGPADSPPVPEGVNAHTAASITMRTIHSHRVNWATVEELYGWEVSNYEVERFDPANNRWKPVAAVVAPPYDDTDEERGSSPRYRVRAVNVAGQPGPWAETGVSGTGGLPRVTLALDPATIKEPDPVDAPDAVTTATVTATLNRASAQNIEVVVSAAPASGIDPAEPGDYTLSENRTLTIPAGQRESAGVVTITANADDDGEDERVAVTAVAAHAQPNISPVILTIDDDDDPGLTLQPAMVTVGEGGTDTYTVKLDAAPPENMDVTVRLTSNNSDVTVDTDTAGDGPQNTLTFTSDNWDTGQTVTVSAAQDADAADDTASITHQASGPFEYQSVRASLAVTVDDNDTAGVTVSDAGITVEEGKSGTYNVRLNTEPAGSVYITVTSDHPSVTVSPSRFSLGRSNWQTGRDVTVYVRNDNDAAVIAATLTHAVDAGATSADEYDGVTIASVSVSVTDDEAPTDYDGDNNGLLEITTAAQLNAIRYDLDGNGKPDAGATGNEAKDYARAFPRMMAGSCGNDFVAGTSEVGDPGNCTGYELLNDIRLSGSWTPIPDFKAGATLEGNGNVISGLSISRGNDDQPVGMFAYNSGTIQNLGLEGVNVRGEASVGALAGRNGGTITGAWSTGRVSGNAHVGGLVGSNRDRVERSYSAATVTGVVLRDSQGPLWSVRTAGLVGLNWGTVENTYAVGDVTGHGHVSGLVGWNDRDGKIINSYAAGKLTAEFSAGGLVGWQTATVTASYWDTEATGVKDGAAQGDPGDATGLTTKEMQERTATGTGWDRSVWKFGTTNDYPCLDGVGPGCPAATGQNRGSNGRSGYARAGGGAAWAVSAPVSYVYDWGIAENLILRDLWRRPRRSGRRAGRRPPFRPPLCPNRRP